MFSRGNLAGYDIQAVIVADSRVSMTFLSAL